MLQILVTLNPQTNQLAVQGQIENKVLALGMLEMAKKVVLDFDPAKQSGIALANGAIPHVPPIKRS